MKRVTIIATLAIGFFALSSFDGGKKSGWIKNAAGAIPVKKDIQYNFYCSESCLMAGIVYGATLSMYKKKGILIYEDTGVQHSGTGCCFLIVYEGSPWILNLKEEADNIIKESKEKADKIESAR